MKTTVLIPFILASFFYSCSTKQAVKEEEEFPAHHFFESKEITQQLRDSIGNDHFIKLSDGFTYYELGGPEDAKEIIVLVHGFSVPAYIWDSTYTSAINKGYRVLRYDVIGRGYSDRPEVVYDINLSYQQLDELTDKLGIKKPFNLVGLSWGGRIVSYYTAMQPTSVKKLILVDPSGFEPVEKKDSLPVKLSDREVAKALRERAPNMAESQLVDFYDSSKFAYWPALYLPQMEYKGFVHALLSTEKNKRSFTNYMAKVANAKLPVKMIMGKQDEVVLPSKTVPAAKEQIPTIDITLIENAGHLPHLEQAAEFNKVFFEFLEN